MPACPSCTTMSEVRVRGPTGHQKQPSMDDTAPGYLCGWCRQQHPWKDPFSSFLPNRAARGKRAHHKEASGANPTALHKEALQPIPLNQSVGIHSQADLGLRRSALTDGRPCHTLHPLWAPGPGTSLSPSPLYHPLPLQQPIFSGLSPAARGLPACSGLCRLWDLWVLAPHGVTGPLPVLESGIQPRLGLPAST